MKEDSKAVIMLCEKVYDFTKKDGDKWINELPFCAKEEIIHPQYGNVAYTFSLDLVKETFYLNFRITIGNSYTERWISFGGKTKVEKDISMYYVDNSLIENKMQEMYMGLLEYPRR